MKITRIRTLVVNAEMRNWVFVQIYTDQDGLHGWGEATLNWKTRAVTGAVEDLAPLAIGKDPRDIEQLVRIMMRHSYYRLGHHWHDGGERYRACAVGYSRRSLGVPVWRLLGGQVRQKIKLYTHLGLGDMRSTYETFDVAAVAERARAVVAQGFQALKVVFIPYTHMTTTLPAVKHVERLAAALREAVGDDVDVMIDFHGRPGTTSAALQYIGAVTDIHPLFCEEPIQPGDSAGMRDICLKTQCPIAAGVSGWSGCGSSRNCSSSGPSTSCSRISITAAVCWRPRRSRRMRR